MLFYKVTGIMEATKPMKKIDELEEKIRESLK